MFALLNLNKPAGLTSRDAVNRVQRLARPHKVGHAGTLDPIATGVLMLCLGPATRLIGYVQQMPKTYHATFELGCFSESDDIELPLTRLADAPVPEQEEIAALLPQFTGTIVQIPPVYSAIKINGRRAYKLARQSQSVDMPPRSVAIYRLEIMAYEYPWLELRVECGSGTYIRSLGRDLARALETRAVMTALTRTAIGPFQLAQAHLPAELTAETLGEALLPPVLAVAGLPQRILSPAEQHEISHGRFLPATPGEQAEEIAAVDEHANLLAILQPRGAEHLGTLVNFIGRS